MKVLGKYRLKKDLPNLEKGAIFEHRTYDESKPDRGNIGCGVMILGGLDGGSCQQKWCGETYIFPGQLSKNKEWFEKVETREKDFLLSEMESLINRLKML